MAQIAAFRNHGFNEVLAEACRKMAEGEILQLCANLREEITEAEYLQIVEYKTATLIAASCKVGAIIGGASAVEQAALYRFGLNLGMAFQVADDRLDYIADGEKLGKSLGQDLRQGMATLPLLHLFRTCSATEKAWIQTSIKKRAISDQDLREIVCLMHTYGSPTYAMAKARQYVEAAALDLLPFPDNPAKRSLAIASQYMITRDQ